jgi:hypothetical protein
VSKMPDETSGSKDKTEAPAPEELKPKADTSQTPAGDGAASTGEHSPASPPKKRPRRGSYRPSHKATFIGLAVVVVILGVNTAVISFIIKGQNKKIQQATGQVTVSQDALSKIGVNSNQVGQSGVLLTVHPDAQFDGNVKIAGAVTIGGALQLNNTFTASDAKFAKLEAGNTSLQQLNVNGDGTVSNFNLRKDLVVVGTSRLEGAVIISQLLTVNNNLNVSGSLSVGGTLSVRTFHASSLVSDNGITFGGHAVTEGSAPSVSKGSALRGTDTVSISGNDASGTVAVNIGVGSVSGALVSVTFRSAYSNTPHVIITPIGSGASDVYIENRSATGFTIGAGSIATGGHAFDYIVEQ